MALIFCDLTHNHGVVLQSQKSSYPKLEKGWLTEKELFRKNHYLASRVFYTQLKERFVIVWGDEWLVTMTNDLSLCQYQIKKMSKNWEKTVSSKMFISRVWIWLIKYFYFEESRDQLPSAFTTVKKESTKISKTKGICNKSSRLIQIVLVKFWFFFVFWTLI